MLVPCGQVNLSDIEAIACDVIGDYCKEKGFGSLRLGLIVDGNGTFECDSCYGGTTELRFIEDELVLRENEWVKYMLLTVGGFSVALVFLVNVFKQGFRETVQEIKELWDEETKKEISYIRDHDAYQLYQGGFGRIKVLLGLVVSFGIFVCLWDEIDLVPDDALTCHLSNMSIFEYNAYWSEHAYRYSNLFDVDILVMIFAWQTLYGVFRMVSAFIAVATESYWDNFVLIGLDLVTISALGVGIYLTVKHMSDFLGDKWPFGFLFSQFFLTWLILTAIRWALWLPFVTFLKKRLVNCFCPPEPLQVYTDDGKVMYVVATR